MPSVRPFKKIVLIKIPITNIERWRSLFPQQCLHLRGSYLGSTKSIRVSQGSDSRCGFCLPACLLSGSVGVRLHVADSACLPALFICTIYIALLIAPFLGKFYCTIYCNFSCTICCTIYCKIDWLHNKYCKANIALKHCLGSTHKYHVL